MCNCIKAGAEKVFGLLMLSLSYARPSPNAFRKLSSPLKPAVWIPA